MPRAIDLSTVDPKRAAELARRRESKRREYLRRKPEMLAQKAAWRMANPDKCAEISAQWGAANTDRKAANTRRWQQKAVAEMSDSYVRANCAQKCPGLSAKDIPPEFTAVARVSMLINRTLRANRP